MVKKILSYLENTDDFNGQFWHNIIKSNDNFPHAPWWNSKSTKLHDDYNPTACLAGFIIRYADKDSKLYSLACRIAKEAVDSYMNQDYLNNMHTVQCYIRLMQYVEEAEADDILDMNALKDKLIKRLCTVLQRIHQNGKQHISVNLLSFSTVKIVYFMLTIRNLLILNVILLLKHNLTMVHGILHGNGQIILQSGP